MTDRKKRGSFLPWLFILCFISGIFTGSILLTFGAGEITLTDASKTSVFLTSFESFLKPCIIIWLFGFTNFSVYASSAVLVYRGGLLGYVIGLVFQKNGLFKAICATLPQNITFLPFLLMLCLTAASRKNHRRTSYIVFLLLTVTVSALSAATDAYITSFLLRR